MSEGATGTPDGSETHPYARLDQAIDAAGDDGWVLVGDGRYVGSLRPPRSIHVLGRCASRVTLEGDLGGPRGTVDASTPGQVVEVRGASIRGPGMGVTASRGGIIRLEQVEVRDTSGAAVFAVGAGSRVDVTDAWIHPADSGPIDGGGYGIVANEGGAVVAGRTAVASMRDVGVSVAGEGSSVILRDGVVRDTREYASLVAGVWIGAGATAVVERSALDDNASFGVTADGTGYVVDSVVRGTRAGRRGATGLSAQGGGHLSATRVLVENSARIGVAVAGAHSILDLVRSVVRAPSIPADESGGCALCASSSGTARVAGSIFEDNVILGLAASGSGTVSIADCVVRRTRPAPSGRFGSAVFATTGGRVVASRFVLANAFSIGVLVQDTRAEGSRAQLADGVIREASNGTGVVVSNARAELSRMRITSVSAAGPDTVVTVADSVVDALPVGAGIGAARSANVAVRGSRIEHSQVSGISVLDATVVISDSVVANTTAGASGHRGWGIFVAPGTVHAERILVTDNRECGVYAATESSRITISDSVVRRTQVGASTGVTGIGIAAERGGRVEAARVLVAENREVGVLSRDPGSYVSFDDGAVVAMVPNDDPRGVDGGSLQAYFGGRLFARRTLVEGGRRVAVNAFGDGGSIVLTDSVVRGTETTLDGVFGFGLSSAFGGSLTARRVLITGSREGGGGVQGSRLDLEDVMVVGTTPSARGFGIGLAAAAGGTLTGERVAIVDVAGTALGSVQTGFVGPSQASRVSVHDLFVRGVLPSQLTTDPMNLERGAGERVGYALFATTACVLDLERSVVDGAQYGLFSRGGVVTWTDGVVTRQTRSAVTVSSVEGEEMLNLRGVRRDGNLSDATLIDPSLPELRLPPPSRPCLNPPTCSM